MVELKAAAIVGIGAQGDGVSETRTFVPGALPGETWIVNGDEEWAPTGEPSAERRPPVCEHFDVCGGCVAQHMSSSLYEGWKSGLLADALAHERIEADMAPIWSVSPGSRRRATLNMSRAGGVVTVGFNNRRTHAVFDMAMCPVLDPAIVKAVPPLRGIGAAILADGQAARVAVTRVDGGLVVVIDSGKIRLRVTPTAQAAVAGLAKGMTCRRLVLNGEILSARGPATLTFGAAEMPVPDACFLQAVPEAEQKLQDLVVAGVDGAKRVADLFCGAGTFALPVAARSKVVAYDDDLAALDALDEGARHTQGLKPVDVQQRDLFRQPLGAREMKGIDAAIVNPPRAGAKAQVQELGASAIKRVVMVSCNPVTFARDARTLIDAGFSIGTVTPVDQFLWSPHLEVVATFKRR